MRHIVPILICFILTAVYASAQEPLQTAQKNEDFVIDYDAIREIVTQDSVYQRLTERFIAFDSTLTLYDGALFYYGFAFQPGYKGSMDAMACPSVELSKAKRYNEAWEQGIEYLNDNPASLTTLFQIINAGYGLSLSREEMDPYALRLFSLLDVIANSGDGKSEKTAFKVISVADEYLFMNLVLNVSKIEKQALVHNRYDLITITGAKNYDGSHIYFDIALPFMHLKKM